MKQFIFLVVLVSMTTVAHAQWTENDQLLSAAYESGDQIPYVLTTIDLKKPEYLFIIQPGGSGSMHLYGNFLVRSRKLFADSETMVVTTDSTISPERINAIVKALSANYPKLKVYMIGTSNGSFSTMRLGERMDGQLAGFIHTSSLAAIGSYDTRTFKSRHLIVHHERDGCRLTPFAPAKNNHDQYGTDFIAIDGGDSYGDPCLAQSYHGYKNIEKEVIDKIKLWVKSSPRR